MNAINLSDWQTLIAADGSNSDQEEVARTLHLMYETPQAFVRVVQRRLIGESERDPQQELFRKFLGEVDDPAIRVGKPTGDDGSLPAYTLAGQIVRHARQSTLKLNTDHTVELDEVIWSIRNCVLSWVSRLGQRLTHRFEPIRSSPKA